MKLKIVQLAQHEAVRVPPSASAAMVSLTNAGSEDAVLAESCETWGALLRLKFNDAEYDASFLQSCARRRLWFDPAREGFVTPAQARALDVFLREVVGSAQIECLYVHCVRGQRRSGAAVLRAAMLCLESAREHELVRPRPEEVNRTLYRLLRDVKVFDEDLALCRPRSRWSLTSWLSLALGG